MSGARRFEVVLAAPAAPDAVPDGAPAPGPLRTQPDDPALVIVIDVLRATTTLAVALAHGAAAIHPVATVAEALAWRAREPAALLCGERDGRIVPGFDLGNSPLDYTRERVGGRALVFASTNGSQALQASRGRRRVLACFRNLGAVVRGLEGERHARILCAGKLGALALEDVACAGMIAVRLGAAGWAPADARAAMVAALAPGDAAAVRALVEGSAQGRHLSALGGGYRRDVAFCAELDVMDLAPTL